MKIELWRLVLITSFGRNADRPFRAALFRIVCLIVLSAALGLYMSRALLKFRIADDLPVVFAAAFVGMIGFVAVGLLILGISSATVRSSGYSQPSLSQQTSIWPLSHYSRWLLDVLPAGLIWAILMITGTWLTVTASRMAYQPLWATIGSLYLCTLAALALGLWHRPRSIALRALAFIAASAVSTVSLEAATRSGKSLYALGVFLSVGALLAIYIWSLVSSNDSFRAKATGRFFRPPPRLLPKAWFSLKIVRNSRSLSSIIFCLVITLATAIVIMLRHIPNRAGWLIFGALISLAFACDIRGLSRRYKAHEISGLDGLTYFARHQLINAWLISLVITFPLLAVNLLEPSVNTLEILGYYLSLQLFAVSCGLLASSLFVPLAGDFGLQFFAAAVSTGLFLVLPKLVGVLGESLAVQIPAWLGLAGVCWLCVYIIEFQRRKRYGHA